MKHYDVLVVGSGFGGSVTALRLTEKGYSVGVMEAGRRFADDELPETSWRLRRYLWAPWARCFGIMRITPLKDVLIASGTGVGGGSLVYANTLYQPLDGFYDDPQWAHVTDWRDELAAHYDQARRMLGVATYPRTTLRSTPPTSACCSATVPARRSTTRTSAAPGPRAARAPTAARA